MKKKKTSVDRHVHVDPLGFDTLARVIADYLSAAGWVVLVAGPTEIRQQPEDAKSSRYEFVMRFTGAKGSRNFALPKVLEPRR